MSEVKWVTVNGRHLQVKDGKLVVDKPTKKHSGYTAKLDESNKYSNQRKKGKK